MSLTSLFHVKKSSNSYERIIIIILLHSFNHHLLTLKNPKPRMELQLKIPARKTTSLPFTTWAHSQMKWTVEEKGVLLICDGRCIDMGLSLSFQWFTLLWVLTHVVQYSAAVPRSTAVSDYENSTIYPQQHSRAYTLPSTIFINCNLESNPFHSCRWIKWMKILLFSICSWCYRIGLV